MGGLLRDNLQPTDFANADCRVTDWMPFGHHGCPAYRVWRCLCGGHQFQRHEWQREGANSTQVDDWIYTGFNRNARHDPHYTNDGFKIIAEQGI